MWSQIAELLGESGEVLDRRIASLGQGRREQALAIELHERRDLGRLDVESAAGRRLANERGCIANIALDIASRAHLHEGSAKSRRGT